MEDDGSGAVAISKVYMQKKRTTQRCSTVEEGGDGAVKYDDMYVLRDVKIGCGVQWCTVMMKRSAGAGLCWPALT
jgi:hypothetical protein